MTNPIDKAQLRALAEAATPGPWTYFPKPKYSEHHVSVPMPDSSMRRALFDDGCPTGAPDAQFIAAANPATIIAPLDEVEHADRYAEQLGRELAKAHTEIEACRAEAARELVEIARDIEALKRECGMDPESPIAIQNGRYMALSYKVRALAAMKEKTP